MKQERSGGQEVRRTEKGSFMLSGGAFFFTEKTTDVQSTRWRHAVRTVTLEQSSVPSGLSPPLQISHSVVPKPQRSVARLSL